VRDLQEVFGKKRVKLVRVGGDYEDTPVEHRGPPAWANNGGN